MPLAATTTFTDSTFDDLPNVSITTYQSDSGKIDIFQTLTAGNPAPALQISRFVPPGPFLTLNYFLNPAFAYNPGTQGSITSIDFSGDVLFQAPITIAGDIDICLISQGGNLYEAGVTLPATIGVWETGRASGLHASDYALITDLRTFAVDATRHPDFSGGPLEFGFLAFWSISGGTSGYNAVEQIDNVSLTVNSATTTTPEPATSGAMLFGLTMLGVVSRVRRRTSLRPRS